MIYDIYLDGIFSIVYFNPWYLFKIQYILNIIACTNHVIVFNGYKSFIFSMYIPLPNYFNKNIDPCSSNLFHHLEVLMKVY